MSKWILRRWHHVSGSELIVPCGVGEFGRTGMKLTGPGKHQTSLSNSAKGKKSAGSDSEEAILPELLRGCPLEGVLRFTWLPRQSKCPFGSG